MDPEQLRQQGEVLEGWIWEGIVERLEHLEDRLAEWLRPAGVTTREVLAKVSDEGLVLAIQQGFLIDEAYEVLLEERYQPRLRRWFGRWGVREEDQEELYRVLFAVLLESRFARYDVRRGHVCGWLWAVAHNLCCSWLARERRLGALENGHEPAAQGDSAEECLLWQELIQRLECWLQQLPDLDQRVMRATLDDKQPAQIAETLGLTPQAVSMRLFRLRGRIETDLDLPRPPRPPRKTRPERESTKETAE
jgi:RNA polymerase sigma factor (sigma-70 family)